MRRTARLYAFALPLLVILLWWTLGDSNVRHAADRLAADRPAADRPAGAALRIEGLEQPVEILKDRWGVSHIYAETERDLFFAQGYNAARDRLFQLEIWRRQATGSTAEIFGERELERDIGTRLFRFRGDLEAELDHYHPRGAVIIRAFVEGVNAYVREAREAPDRLPVEFQALGILPEEWTPEVVISRHQGLLYNVSQELALGRAVHAAGADLLLDISDFHPGTPDIELDPALDGDALNEDILGLYEAFHSALRFEPEDLRPDFRTAYAPRERPVGAAGGMGVGAQAAGLRDPAERAGSNNWILSPSRTQSGRALLANDPHRVIQAPSLRYMVHLVGPGWNVIGGGEPAIPGVSIGHNEHGAWGLTVFLTDAEDLYVYRTNPDRPDQYAYRDAWEEMVLEETRIEVRGEGTRTETLRYTRHGPVVFQDSVRNLAYAVRAGWLEIGGAPYLASLRMDQATTWEEFREACTYSHIPGENMIWADTAGNIGWQAVGIAPVRRNWSGLVPVPGDGRYEWDGYLPIADLPHVLNPPEGYFATANEHVTPSDYPHRDAIGWVWSAPYRGDRIREVLAGGAAHTLQDMMQLQTDYLSIPARTLVPLLEPLPGLAGDRGLSEAREMLLGWDRRLEPESAAAGLYVAWERELAEQVERARIPDALRPAVPGVAFPRAVRWLVTPPPWMGEIDPSGDPIAGRDRLVLDALSAAVADMTDRFGPDRSGWRYGDPAFKHARIRHPLSGAANEDLTARLEVGPAVRGGNSFTVGQTGGGDNQTSGATFRFIAEMGDWDAAVAMNSPGQGGDPGSRFYANLFDLWAADRFFPLYYSREWIERVTAERIELAP